MLPDGERLEIERDRVDSAESELTEDADLLEPVPMLIHPFLLHERQEPGDRHE